MKKLNEYDRIYLERLRKIVIESREELTMFLNEIEVALTYKELERAKAKQGRLKNDI